MILNAAYIVVTIVFITFDFQNHPPELSRHIHFYTTAYIEFDVKKFNFIIYFGHRHKSTKGRTNVGRSFDAN